MVHDLTTEPLADRLDALGRFVRIVSSHVADLAPATVDPDALAAAGALADRAVARLRQSGEHTVVALAGATGGGKSSLFNALANMELSTAGALRPTTGAAHACVWGTAGADGLLDWLGVEPSRRFVRESLLDAEDEAPLRGLVLLDLPDMDSVATAHRVEADRLVRVVDLVVWVLDPQKYADQTVHEDYLRHMGALRDVTVVVFNQTDRLTPADAARCLADLARLVDADGLPGIPVIATSALTGEGVGEVRTLLEKTIAGRQAALARLEGELGAAVEDLAPLVASAAAVEDAVTRDVVLELADDFAAAAGVRAVAADGGQAYARRAALPGWPFRRSRRNARLAEVLPDGLPPAEPAAVGLAVRRLAARAAAGLPPPWPDEVLMAASRNGDRLPDELGRAVGAASPVPPLAIGWKLARVGWWLAIVSVLAGAAWLGWHAIDRDRNVPAFLVGRVWLATLMVVAGAVVALLILLVGRPLAAARARRFRAASERRLRDVTATVAREVVAPVRAVLRDYADARAALDEAATNPRRS